MPVVTIVSGLLLIVVGCYGYFVPGSRSITALIPAFLGGVFVLLGALAFVPPLRKHVMHAAATLGLLGFLAAGSRLIKPLMALASAEPWERPIAVYAQGLMALICAAFVAICVLSFISARKAREARQQNLPPAS